MQLSQRRGAREIARETGVSIDAVLSIIFGRYRMHRGRVTVFETPGQKSRRKQRGSNEVVKRGAPEFTRGR